MTSPLFVDTYSGAPQPDWFKFIAAGSPWHGAIIKATQGTGFAPNWFAQNWPVIKNAAGVRYGVDFFRGAYHYLMFNTDGAKQADFFLNVIDRAGGWDVGDLWPFVDVERGQDSSSNHAASGQQILDSTMAFAERCKQRTGRKIVLYGNNAMYDKGITSHMSCDYLWIARYTATLPREVYTRIGWSLEELFAWQYSDSKTSLLAGYPKTAPGVPDSDISALTFPGGLDGLRSQLWAENPNQAPTGGLVAAGLVGGFLGALAFSRGLFRWLGVADRP